MALFKKMAGFIAGVSTVAGLGVAVAQGVPPNPFITNPALGAGQQSTHLTPMGETGVLWEMDRVQAATITPIAEPTAAAPPEPSTAQAEPAQPTQPEPPVAQAEPAPATTPAPAQEPQAIGAAPAAQEPQTMGAAPDAQEPAPMVARADRN